MPYKIQRSGSQFCVVKETDGKKMGCHPSKAQAEKQMAALYANEPGIGKAYDAGAPKAKRKNRILRSLTINEISGVDKAAQVPAEALLMKADFTAEQRKQLAADGKAMSDGGYPIRNRADLENAIQSYGRAANKAAVSKWIKRRAKELGAEDLLPKDGDLAKGMFGDDADDMARPTMTTETEGHQHVFDDAGQAGETTCAQSQGEQYGHTHSWVRMLDNSVVFAATDGHTHEVLPTTKSATGGEANMSDTKNEVDAAKAQTEAVQKSLNEMTKRAERAEAISKLNADERGLFETLGADADAFLAKTVEQRAEQVKESKDSNRVVFKALDGTEYRASDDKRLIALAKKADADSKATAEAIAKAEQIGFEKRANEEIPHLPGTVEVRAKVLKVLQGVEGASEILKAAEAALAKAFVAQGTTAGADLNKAEDKLENLAKAHAEAKKVSIEKARAEVLTTPEGAALYAEMDARAIPAD